MERRADPLASGILNCADVQFEQLHIIQQHTEWLQNLVERLIFTDEELSDDENENDRDDEETSIRSEDQQTTNGNDRKIRKRKARLISSSSSSSEESTSTNSESTGEKEADRDEPTANGYKKLRGRNVDKERN